MSAVDRPNKNFDNETKTHTPYSEVMQGRLQSAYEQFRRPKQVTDKNKKKKPLPEPIRTTMNKWFNTK